MSTKHMSFLKPLALALVVGVLAAPGAGAAPARDAAVAARGATASAPPVQVVKVTNRGGFDWGDAGIGAGAIFSVLLAGLGATVLAGHRRPQDARQPDGRRVAN